MAKQTIPDYTDRRVFADYCWDFYGPGHLYGHFFDDNLTRQELNVAVVARMKHDLFEGDTIDREAVRDLLLEARNKPTSL